MGSERLWEVRGCGKGEIVVRGDIYKRLSSLAELMIIG